MHCASSTFPPPFKTHVHWRGNLILMFLIHLHLTHQNPTWWEPWNANKSLEVIFSFNLRNHNEELFSLALVRGARQNFSFALRFCHSKKNYNFETHCHTMYLVFVNSLKSGTTILWKVKKYGLRFNSSYVLSTVWVSGSSVLPTSFSLLWISERLSFPLLQSKCIGDTVHL